MVSLEDRWVLLTVRPTILGNIDPCAKPLSLANLESYRRSKIFLLSQSCGLTRIQMSYFHLWTWQDLRDDQLAGVAGIKCNAPYQADRVQSNFFPPILGPAPVYQNAARF